MGIDNDRVKELLARARREVDAGLLPSAQIALAYEGELVAFETFGDATNDSRYVVFSATKAFVASMMWQLLADGSVGLDDRVVEHIPEFDTNGKDVITVEQVILHTAGFPQAPLGPPAWATLDGRLAAFARWRLNWEPGTSYEYHATSAHWVLADIVRRVTGLDHRDALEQRVTTPLGLPRVLGFEPGAAQDNIAELSCVGDPATPEEMKAVFGVAELGVTEVTAETLVRFNEPAARAVGVPGGGAIMRASDLALFYQALLHNTGEVWDGAVLTDATRHVRNTLPDRMTRIPANRALGVIQAGDDGHSNVRGFGRAVSAGAFGHNGAGGQLAWVDPASGLSLGYCTNGMDMHMVREARRGTAISSLAAVCVS